MKVIKLRAWDPYDNKWAHFTIGESFGSWAEHVYKSLCLEGVEFYMFTGLLDKNGKEIYEGDIIQNVADDGRRLSKFEISWQQSCCGFVKEREDGHTFTLEISKYFEVIGNIHENPDLL